MTTYVYDFSAGGREMVDLLGGKGANLGEMTKLGLPVPPGFTISTEACKVWLAQGHEPEGLRAEVDEHLAALEQTIGRRLGDPDDPLLVSVRSGAKFSMPGMMETVLNVGLNDELGARVWPRAPRTRGSPGTPTAGSSRCSARPCSASTASASSTPSTAEGRAGRRRRRRPRRRRPAGAGDDVQGHRAGRRRPSTSRRTRASSSTSPSAPSSTPGTPTGRGSTAARSASPTTSAPPSTSARWSSATSAPTRARASRFTRDPATGEQGVYGDYLPNAQGEDVVAGIRNTVPLADLGDRRPRVVRRAAGRHGDARAALQGPVRHRVHRRARQALDAADPRRQAHGRGGLPDRRRSSSTRA